VDGHSLHVTFGITKRTGVTWLNYLSDAARADEVFRTDLEREGGFVPGEVLASKLAELARAYEPERYLDDLRANTPAARHLPYIPTFGALEQVAAVTEFRPAILRESGTVQVLAAGKRLTFHPRAEPGLRTLLSGHPVHLADGDRDVLTLAEHLIQEGLCEPLNTESSSGYTGLVTPVTCFKELSNAV
jgi:hypothetical protein